MLGGGAWTGTAKKATTTTRNMLKYTIRKLTRNVDDLGRP